jgi:gluconate kinase
MFIVIEGSDGSGKSSLTDEVARQLVDKYPDFHVTRFHKGRPEEETRRWVLNDWVMSIESIDWFEAIAVADRWHWGEATYAPLKRPHTCKDAFGLLGVAGWRWTEWFMASRGIAQFWLYQPLDVIKSRVAVRGDDFVKLDELEKIVDLYEQTALEVLNLTSKLTPRADSATIDLLAKHVIYRAEEVADEAKKLAPFGEYIGSPNPKILYIGNWDTTNSILPCFPAEESPEEALIQSLPDSVWRNVGIVNQSDMSSDRLNSLIKVLGNPKVERIQQ